MLLLELFDKPIYGTNMPELNNGQTEVSGDQAKTGVRFGSDMWGVVQIANHMGFFSVCKMSIDYATHLSIDELEGLGNMNIRPEDKNSSTARSLLQILPILLTLADKLSLSSFTFDGATDDHNKIYVPIISANSIQRMLLRKGWRVVNNKGSTQLSVQKLNP